VHVMSSHRQLLLKGSIPANLDPKPEALNPKLVLTANCSSKAVYSRTMV